MVVPELPLDAIYVVGCHLAGRHAFGTLASLHVASHEVADTVLPILYETVLADNREKIPFLGNGQHGSQDRVFYTKYGLNEVAIVDADISTTIRKPVSAATLYGIIALTPGDRLSSVEVNRCDMPYLSSLFLEEQAYLIPDTTVNPSWTTCIRLLNTSLCGEVTGNCKDLDTMFGLLKLARRVNLKILRGSDIIQYWGQKEDAKYHLELHMTKQGYDAFAERFLKEILLHPEIFLNRISMRIADEIVPTDVFCTLFDDLLDIYATHVTSYDNIRRSRHLPYNLLVLRADTLTLEERHQQPPGAQTPWSGAGIQVGGKEGEMRFVLGFRNLEQ